MYSSRDLRDIFLRAAVAFGVALFAITESLGALHALRRIPLLLAWTAITIAALTWARRRRLIPIRRPKFDWIVAVYGAACAAIFTATAIAAAFSPPNSADAMAYHIPRVLFWAEQASVRFFPTPYFNQIMLQPFAEYAMLHTFLLSGGDRFVNFVQWTASVASAIAVSAIAREFGASPRAQAFAVLVCAAIPAGILASSGAKNDYVLAFCLAAAIYFALCWRESRLTRDAVMLGCALGLALLTKATAYVFAPWPIAAILARPVWESRRRAVRPLLLAAACALLINLPHYARNFNLSGSPLGYGDSFGTGEFRWRNETFGWKQTVSNVLRNASEQLGARSEAWNRALYNAVISTHRWLGIDPTDPATTWRWSAYAPPRNANHEADAPNRLHLALFGALFCILLWRAARGRQRLLAAYAATLVIAFVVFCAYLKWQPFMARLFLPLFVLAAPLACIVRPVWLQVALCILLLDSARRPALENWVRPLRGPNSVFSVPRDRQYFSDMVQWKEDWPAYPATVDELSKHDCGVVAIDVSHFQLEYPLEALLRERRPGIQFVHAGVHNASAKYRQPVEVAPCAIVCLHCDRGDWRSGSFTVTFVH